MSGNLPMGIAGNPPRVRYSAAYPTGRERMLRQETKAAATIKGGASVTLSARKKACKVNAGGL